MKTLARDRRSCDSAGMRRGFSLLEALLALLLLSFALLAFAAALSISQRDLTLARRRSIARELAVNGVERLRPGACGGTASGSMLHPGDYHEHWGIEMRLEGRLAAIVDSVGFSASRDRRETARERATVACETAPALH